MGKRKHKEMKCQITSGGIVIGELTQLDAKKMVLRYLNEKKISSRLVKTDLDFDVRKN